MKHKNQKTHCEKTVDNRKICRHKKKAGDIIKSFKDEGVCSVAAYVVSGEYKMLYDYGQNCGCMQQIVLEAHVGLLRAGADILITYFAPYLLGLNK